MIKKRRKKRRSK